MNHLCERHHFRACGGRFPVHGSLPRHLEYHIRRPLSLIDVGETVGEQVTTGALDELFVR
jgi:hypothetical protein